MTLIDEMPKGAWEREYVLSVAMHLGSYQETASLTMVATQNTNCVPIEGSDVFVYLISNERRVIPRYSSNVSLVLTQYCPQNAPRNVCPVPIGIFNGFPSLPIRPMSERAIDICFSGYRHASRLDFLQNASALQRTRRYESLIQFFGNGREKDSIENYASILYNTRISLCPQGALNPETFRVCESIRCGCIVVTAKQPANCIYRGWPGIELERWDSVADCVAALLGEPERLDQLQLRAVDWWQERWCEPAVARYILDELVAVGCISGHRLAN